MYTQNIKPLDDKSPVSLTQHKQAVSDMSPKYRQKLPQLTSSQPFLSEGGIETTLIYDKKIDLPHFATLILLDTPEGVEQLRDCYFSYIAAAVDSALGIVLETRT